MELHEVTLYQWLVLVLGAIGFFITWTRGAVNATRAISAITEDTTKKIAVIHDEIATVKEELVARIVEDANKSAALVHEISNRFDAEQEQQNRRFGELVAAVREYIRTVEKEMHAIELWGRDNYVLKTEFTKSLDTFGKTLDEIAKYFREDTKALNTKLDSIILNRLKAATEGE